MAKKSCVRLNYCCLLEVLKQIKINCEANKSTDLDKVKYADLISFALTCEWFRNVLREWDSDLYDRLDIEQTYFSQSESVIVNIDNLHKDKDKYKDMFWKTYINALELNTQLESIEIKYMGQIYNRDHGEIIDMLISAIQNKQRLKKLNIDMEGCFLDRLPQLRHLKQLSFNTNLNVTDLIDFCKSNPKLTRLSCMNNENNGKLTDIVPHCKNLKDVTFLIKTDFDDYEYIEFAKLPNLVNLRIRGVHKSGSLSPLIRSLVTKKSSTLKSLLIDTSLEISDVVEACSIESLQEFKSRVVNMENFNLNMSRSKNNEILSLNFDQQRDATDLAPLSNLTSLKTLRIVGQHRTGTLKSLFIAIAEKKSPNLKCLRSKELPKEHKSITMFNNDEMLEVFKIDSLKTLHCCFSDTEPMEFSTDLPQISTLTIESHKTGSLRNLFKAFGQQMSSELTSLTIEGASMTLEDLTEINKIKSLSELDCGIEDVNDIYILSQPTNLETLTISSNHSLYEISQAILKFFEASNGNVSIYSPANCIVIDRNVRALTITMSPHINSRDLVPLASLPNLPNLIIYEKCQRNALQELLKAFASSSSTVLQEIAISKNHVSLSEVQQIAQIKTLRYLLCGFSDPESLMLLKELPVLETLRITSTHNFSDIAEGVLEVLKECSNEMTVIRDFREITFRKDSKKLTIFNSSYDDSVHNAQEYASLPKLPEVKSLLIIGRHELGTFKELFASLAVLCSSTLEEIIFKVIYAERETSINYDETVELTKIASLKRLRCGFSDMRCVELLTKLTNLEDLTITTSPDGSLLQFLRELATKEHCILQSLNLSSNSLTFEDVAQVSRVNSLKRLKCTLSDGQNMDLLAKMKQLEKLTIAADECNSLATLFRALTSPASNTLHDLTITDRSVSLEEMMIIAEIKHLRELCCTLDNPESIKLLVQLPELTELSLEIVDGCDTRGIESLAQLNHLTALKLTLTEPGTLIKLFQQLSSRESQILRTLIVSGKDIDSCEMQAISQLKSLRRLQCGFEEEVLYESLSDLTELEVLEIKSYLIFNDISQTVLKILQKCHKINDIIIYFGSRFVGFEFLDDALKILKAVRNPDLQDALRLHIPYFGELTPEQIAIADENLLIICRLKDDID